MFPDGMIHRSPRTNVVCRYWSTSRGRWCLGSGRNRRDWHEHGSGHDAPRVTTVRSGFEQPIPLDQSLADLEPEFTQMILRDAALVAAVDGAYDRKELAALRKIAKKANVSPKQLSDLLDWSPKVGIGLNKEPKFWIKMNIFHPFVERHLQREKAVPSVWWGRCKTG